MKPVRLRSLLTAFGTFVLLALVAIAPTSPHAATVPAAPEGLTAIALDSAVGLAWRPSTGAASYALYRGTSATTITQRVTPDGFAGTAFKDTTAANGTIYFYEVHARSAEGESTSDQTVRATPQARSCSTGNAIRVENCFPGTTAWKSTDAEPSYPNGIEGFLSASSVDAGGSVELRTTADWDVSYHAEIYRTGHYGGDQGRLISQITGRTGRMGFCDREPSTTGLVDCADWDRAATISTTSDWTSGVYLIKLVRDDNGAHSEVPLVVRDDGGTSDVLYGVPTSTYQAYNAWFGKSLYSYSSDGPTTVTGANRAVQAAFDRPYSQPPSSPAAHDYYTRTDLASVDWLEEHGYDVSFIASEDLHTDGAQLTHHKVFISGSHDEYWSQQMFDAAIAARDAGTSLVFLGANAAYWRVRFIPNPSSGRANRVMVAYKTIEGGPADPSGSPTTTWRDPAGPNRPENELIGQQYIGDNAADSYPLKVSAAEGRHRVWRYSSLGDLEAGTTASVGSAIVGWEWDARASNGREPAGVQTLASSPVTGNLVQGSGGAYSFGSATQTTTLYRAASSALVFSAGTNNWWRGLSHNVHGEGEPSARIQQATANVLSDMGARPTSLAGGLQVDPLGPPQVSSTSPTDGGASVALDAPVQATLDRELDPGTVDSGDLTVTGPDGAVAGAVSLDNATKSVTFRADEPLEPNSAYTARLGTAINSWHGDAPAAPVTWTFTAGPGVPPKVVSRTPATDATGVFTDATISARTDRRLDPASVTTSSFTMRPASGGSPVAAQAGYDAETRTARLTPDARLAPSTRYTAELGTGVRASDGIALAEPVSWSFTTGTNLQVSGRFPAAGATGISDLTAVRIAFSRAVDAATVTSATVRLAGPGGTPVAAGVSFDPAANTAALVPSSGLLLGTTYTVDVSSDIRAADGAPADGASWTFTTAATSPPAPQTTSLFPAAGATSVANGAAVSAVFDRALDPTSVTAQTFTLTPDGGSPIAATVAYDDTAHRATLTPLASLATGTRYTATLTTGIRTTTGAPLATTQTWSFTAARCPCSLMTGVQPTWTGLPVHDFRPGPGPFSYELGTKVTVSETAQLIALRFWKEPGETGTHVGRVWSAAGTQLASVTYQNETASGWQRQALATPLTLSPGQTYTLSTGLREFYAKTVGGLTGQIASGPLRTVADGANGVYNETAGQFPTSSWQSSNYFVDGVAKLPGEAAHTPAVVSLSPLSGATGVATGASVRARFSTDLDPSTINTSTFTLTSGSGAPIAGSVSYDEADREATFTPSAGLDTGTSYTARLTTGVRSDDETPLPSAVTSVFSTIAPGPPVVTGTSPVDGATDLSLRTQVTVTFDTTMNASTITASSFGLTGPGGTAVPSAVSYDSATRTATLTPNAPLASATPYLARVTTAVRSTSDVPLAADQVWSLTTSNCPCRLFSDATPAFNYTGLSTSNGRGGGAWTLEMGAKVRVTQPADVQAIRFFKDTAETGSHVGRVWTASGALVGSVAFTGESASGWQQQALPAPLALTPGQTYVVSVGINTAFGMQIGAFNSAIGSGPLTGVADGQNGVFADAAGSFPTQSWGNSSYGIDVVAG